MSTLKELRNIRIKKLNKLRQLRINPYPSQSYRNTLNNEIDKISEDLNLSHESKDNEVIIAGRIMPIREHWALRFIDIQDITHKRTSNRF